MCLPYPQLVSHVTLHSIVEGAYISPMSWRIRLVKKCLNDPSCIFLSFYIRSYAPTTVDLSCSCRFYIYSPATKELIRQFKKTKLQHWWLAILPLKKSTICYNYSVMVFLNVNTDVDYNDQYRLTIYLLFLFVCLSVIMINSYECPPLLNRLGESILKQ